MCAHAYDDSLVPQCASCGCYAIGDALDCAEANTFLTIEDVLRAAQNVEEEESDETCLVSFTRLTE